MKVSTHFVYDVRPRSAADALSGGPPPRRTPPPWVFGALAAIVVLILAMTGQQRRALLGVVMMVLAIGGELALVIVPIAVAWFGASRFARRVQGQKGSDADA